MKLQIGARIRSHRKKCGLSQIELAKRVGISSSYLNLIEHDKRSVAGKLLSDIAHHLELSQDRLSGGITTDMIERLQQTARRFSGDISGDRSELKHIDQFITHFPLWAQLLDQQISELEQLEQLNELLSDRMSHDPVLSETLHVMLSNITAIRSTAELLVTQGGMAEAQRSKFLHNIFLESKRLSATAEKLLLHFDSKTSIQTQQRAAAPAETLPKQSAASGQDEFSLQPVPASIAADPDFQRAQQMLTPESLKSDSLKASQHQFNPFIIADTLGLPVRAVFFRLAELAGHPDFPQFGLLEIDSASGVIFRQETAAFRLPSRSGACPRWPIYRALGVVGQAVGLRMQLNSGEVFTGYAWAESRTRHHSQLPSVNRSLMLFYKNSSKSAGMPLPLIEVGFHCSVCPRNECEDRRESYALISEGLQDRTKS